jgi:hypothetical protein
MCSVFKKINYIEVRKQKLVLYIGYWKFQGVAKFDEYRPNYRYITLKVDQNSFYPACFLYHGNSSPDEILSVCAALVNWEMYP